MKTKHIVLLVAGLGAAYLVMRGRATAAAPAATNAGTVAPPVVGASPAPVPTPAVNMIGNETTYTTVKGSVVEQAADTLQSAFDKAVQAMMDSVRA